MIIYEQIAKLLRLLNEVPCEQRVRWCVSIPDFVCMWKRMVSFTLTTVITSVKEPPIAIGQGLGAGNNAAKRNPVVQSVIYSRY